VAFQRRIKRTRRGTYELALPAAEREVLTSLVPQVRALLTSDGGAGEISDATRRLYPTAYAQDVEADAEYQRLMHDELVAMRLSKLDQFADTIDSSEIDEAHLVAWMGVVNDIRLVLGTRLDVSEDMDESSFADDDPSTPAFALYAYLGWLLEQIVDALSD
jgi:hypothetical protein